MVTLRRSTVVLACLLVACGGTVSLLSTTPPSAVGGAITVRGSPPGGANGTVRIDGVERSLSDGVFAP